MPPLHIAIDGPVASGKSTISERVARALNILYLDTGVMYRAITLFVLLHQIDPADPVACGAAAESLDLLLLPATIDDGRQLTVIVSGADVTWDIRSDQVNRYVSLVSSHPRVRAALRLRQQDIASSTSVVMAGRDIASVVLPDAQVKIFLTASVDERVRRRALELQQRQPDISVDRAFLHDDIVRRDAEDAAQMLLTPDTRILATDGVLIDDVVQQILEIVHDRYH